MLRGMRVFFSLFIVLLLFRWAFALFLFVLALTTAPDDTSLLLRKGSEVMSWLQGNLALDLTLLIVGLMGLVLAFGWGNWRLALHRYYGKQRLKRLGLEARRVAEDIANTISQEKQIRDRALGDTFTGPEGSARFLRETTSQDQRYLSKHMMEASSIIRRLDEVGYWRPKEFLHEIGIAGATGFAAEATCKELYTASDRIESDLEDGLISLLTQPQLPEETAKGKRR